MTDSEVYCSKFKLIAGIATHRCFLPSIRSCFVEHEELCGVGAIECGGHVQL